MKRRGDVFEYERERNRDLMRAYHHCIKGHRGNKSVYIDVVNMPAERFWISEGRAAVMVSLMMKGASLDDFRPTRREMLQEIYKRVLELKEIKPNETIYNLTLEVVNQKAPKFYLTPRSAKTIISKIRTQWYEKRKLKLRLSRC